MNIDSDLIVQSIKSVVSQKLTLTFRETKSLLRTKIHYKPIGPV